MKAVIGFLLAVCLFACGQIAQAQSDPPSVPVVKCDVHYYGLFRTYHIITPAAPAAQIQQQTDPALLNALNNLAAQNAQLLAAINAQNALNNQKLLAPSPPVAYAPAPPGPPVYSPPPPGAPVYAPLPPAAPVYTPPPPGPPVYMPMPPPAAPVYTPPVPKTSGPVRFTVQYAPSK